MYLGRLLICCALLSASKAANVLIIQCVFTRSYSNILEGIANVLATEHNVTLISRHQLNEANPNITLVQFGQIRNDVAGEFKDVYTNALTQDETSQFGVDTALFVKKEFIEDLLEDPVTEYIKETRQIYDVLVMPMVLSGAFVRFAHLLNVPLVQVATSYSLPWQNEAIGNPVYLSTDPSLLISPYPETFYGRLGKTIQGVKMLHQYYYDYLPNLDRLTEKYFPPGTPSTNEVLMKRTSLLLVNTQAAMMRLRPKVPNYLEIGGLHCRPAKPLASPIKDFIESAGPHGLIYMSLGQTINSTFPQDIIQSFLHVFGKLPQKVIFKMGQELHNVPANVLVLRFSPQQDILGHPNTRLFITQGGMLSLQEAVYHKVPVLVLPLSLDQPTSAILAHKLGYGAYLRFSQFSEEAFLSSIKKVLSNPSYTRRIEDVSAFSKDTFKEPKEELKWWIKYVIRHRNQKTKRSFGYNPPAYYIDEDILLFFIFVAATLLFLLGWLANFVLKIVTQYKKIKTE